MAVLRPDLMMKCVIPVVMAGIIAIVRVALCLLPMSIERSSHAVHRAQADPDSTVWSSPS